MNKNLPQFWSQSAMESSQTPGTPKKKWNWSVVKHTNFYMYFPPAITYVVGHDNAWLWGQDCSFFHVEYVHVDSFLCCFVCIAQDTIV